MHLQRSLLSNDHIESYAVDIPDSDAVPGEHEKHPFHRLDMAEGSEDSSFHVVTVDTTWIHVCGMKISFQDQMAIVINTFTKAWNSAFSSSVYCNTTTALCIYQGRYKSSIHSQWKRNHRSLGFWNFKVIFTFKFTFKLVCTHATDMYKLFKTDPCPFHSDSFMLLLNYV